MLQIALSRNFHLAKQSNFEYNPALRRPEVLEKISFYELIPRAG